MRKKTTIHAVSAIILSIAVCGTVACSSGNSGTAGTDYAAYSAASSAVETASAAENTIQSTALQARETTAAATQAQTDTAAGETKTETAVTQTAAEPVTEQTEAAQAATEAATKQVDTTQATTEAATEQVEATQQITEAATQQTTEAQTSEPDTTAAAQTDAASYVDEVIRLVNENRAANGLAPLAKNEGLCNAAAQRASEITVQFSHTRPDGSSCFTILDEYGISYTGCGENIAAGQPDPASVMKAWMNSTGHRENILRRSFGEIGVGVVTTDGGYGIYWVQLFKD